MTQDNSAAFKFLGLRTSIQNGLHIDRSRIWLHDSTRRTESDGQQNRLDVANRLGVKDIGAIYRALGSAYNLSYQ